MIMKNEKIITHDDGDDDDDDDEDDGDQLTHKHF